MKRFFLLMSMIACLCLSAVCPAATVDASSTAGTEVVYTEAQYQEAAEAYMQQIVAFDDATIDTYIASGSLDSVTVATLESWKEMRAEVGEFVAVTDSEVTIDDDIVTVVVTAQFTDREGTFTLVSSTDMATLTSASFDKVYTMGEIFEKAALNTLMGMGTVFAVLIFISFIISLFKYIPNIQAFFSKKKDTAEVDESVVEEYAEVQEEELVDDKELVAVIMAAIYASMESEGKAVSRDGLVVRSIRKSRR